MIINLKKIKEAILSYLKCVEANPKDIASLNNIGTLYGLENNIEKSL